MQGEGQPAAPLKVEFSFKRRNLCLHSVFPTKIKSLITHIYECHATPVCRKQNKTTENQNHSATEKLYRLSQNENPTNNQTIYL